jgi:type II secretory pathway component PulC
LRYTWFSVGVLVTLGASCAAAASLGAGFTAAGPIPQPQAAAARAQPGESLPASALPMALVGVMADSSAPSRSACLIRCAYPGERRSASNLEVGAVACNLAEIKEIRPREVVVRNLLTDRLELLALPEGSSPPGVASPAESAPVVPPVVKASPEGVTVELPKASVERYLLNLPDLLNSAQATPRYTDSPNGQRVVEGFQVGQIKAGSVVEQLGLRNGDVILEVNGEKLDSVATVLRLFGQVQTATQARLTVLRGSQRLTFVFNTR